jgi:hypothetical protein
MMLKRNGLWLAGLLLVVLLAACGAGAVAPTATPVYQTFQTSAIGANVAFSYPEGWVALVDKGQIVVANSSAAVQSASPQSGQFIIRMVIGPISVISGLSPSSTAQEVVQFFVKSIGSTGVTFGDTADLTLGAYSAARVAVSSSDGQGNITAVSMGDGIFNIASVVSANGELKQYEPVLDTILASLVYSKLGSPEATSAVGG